MFRVRSSDGEFRYSDPDESFALFMATNHVINNNIDVEVVLDGEVVWYVEADTPVEDGGDIPAIVHRRRDVGLDS